MTVASWPSCVERPPPFPTPNTAAPDQSVNQTRSISKWSRRKYSWEVFDDVIQALAVIVGSFVFERGWIAGTPCSQPPRFYRNIWVYRGDQPPPLSPTKARSSKKVWSATKSRCCRAPGVVEGHHAREAEGHEAAREPQPLLRGAGPRLRWGM